jgi:HlyB family type I secretion system ABC transporter
MHLNIRRFGNDNKRRESQQTKTGFPVSLEALWLLSELMLEKGFPVSRMREAIALQSHNKTVSWESAIIMAQTAGARLVASHTSWLHLDQLQHDWPCIFVDRDERPVVVVRYFVPGDIQDFPLEDGQFESRELLQEAILVARRHPETGHIETEIQERSKVELWWSGTTLGFAILPSQSEPRRDFTIGWFLGQVLRRRSLLGAIILAIVVVHALGLAIPLFFQAVIDKVLPNEARITLVAISVGVIVVIVFDGFLKFVRDYMISHVAAKLDILTATQTFRHLLNLPMGFFQKNSAGVITNNIQQADQLREFVTGRVLFAFIEFTGIVVFLPVLALFYSPTLAAIVVVTGLLMAGTIAVFLRSYYRLLNTLYETEGERKTILVETISGISTVKSLSLAGRLGKAWDAICVRAVDAGFRLRRLNAIVSSTVEVIDQVGTVFVLWIGVNMVFAGELTIGALIAFRMLSNQVTDPLKNLSELIHEYQRMKLAARMLGRVMHEPGERVGGDPSPAQNTNGHIVFDDVTFQFPGRYKPALNRISFEIFPGECVGITGRSGSGKSTIACLVQGLYEPQSGEVRIDGKDTRQWDLHALRSMSSVVLQENFLFRGTVAENISMTNPRASMADIEMSAWQAGAHEFIAKLPQGYREMIAENGANFSGGQKQRLAIARALLKPHSILIFDEATSALDVESEEAIQENMQSITAGKTSLIIAHRLSTLRLADRIMVLEGGNLIDFRPLDELLDLETGCPLFRGMWIKQTGSAVTQKESVAEREYGISP